MMPIPSKPVCLMQEGSSSDQADLPRYFKRRHALATMPNAPRIDLQKVIASSPTSRGHSTLVLRDGAEDTEFRLETFANVHDGRDIAAAVAVVGRRPDGDDGFLSEMVLILSATARRELGSETYLVAFID